MSGTEISVPRRTNVSCQRRPGLTTALWYTPVGDPRSTTGLRCRSARQVPLGAIIGSTVKGI
jgi:hypothetical protein